MKEVLPVVLSLCQDVDFEVRGYMCRQLDIIAKGIGYVFMFISRIHSFLKYFYMLC